MVVFFWFGFLPFWTFLVPSRAISSWNWNVSYLVRQAVFPLWFIASSVITDSFVISWICIRVSTAFPFQTVRKTIFSPFFWLCWPQFCLDIRFEIAFCLSFFSFCCLVTHRSIGYEALNQISNGGAGFEFSVGVSASFRLNFCTDLILVVFFFTGIGSQFRLIFIRVFRLNWLKTANC